MIKKLTKNKIKEMLEKNYFMGNVKNIFIDNDTLYVIYSYYMIRFTYSKSYGWSFALYGEVLYTFAKYLVEIINKLEGNYYLEGVND